MVLGEVGVADREHENSLLHSAGKFDLSARGLGPGAPVEPPLVLACLGRAAKSLQVLLLWLCGCGIFSVLGLGGPSPHDH